MEQELSNTITILKGQQKKSLEIDQFKILFSRGCSRRGCICYVGKRTKLVRSCLESKVGLKEKGSCVTR